ncbi:hypothetical protein HPC49_10015 [Pyxidicoccus fallax]|uniref:Lipoprotein n=1 Tax=Pyxidicoccus fallax TaxID=394095 RepID=A0A848LK24_9BACT|nr:hypothetical protein [Pyxidicoccus fallax]NMO18071.1 hypothetical protein [Pyxidicoccus fallax]NPC78577.1 hypothetical protein [Pyxidicoccus fallax]
MRPRIGRIALLGWLLVSAFGAGCATGVAGRIPPAVFQFHEVVRNQGGEAGGWKVSQTTITLTRVSRTHPVRANCDVEIGVPLRSVGGGAVPDVVAQEAAATAADQAARFALGRRPVTSAELCDLFLLEMRRLLAATLRGCRVRRFVEPDIPQTTFVPE